MSTLAQRKANSSRILLIVFLCSITFAIFYWYKTRSEWQKMNTDNLSFFRKIWGRGYRKHKLYWRTNDRV